MAWETRRRNRYYYRSRRVDGKVRKEYVGTGADAELVAKADAAAIESRDQERKELRGIVENVQAANSMMKNLDDAVRVLTAGSLLAAGYHQHRGHWRKRRV